jgi:uncharacterized coiled-coil DUF342 family protein
MAQSKLEIFIAARDEATKALAGINGKIQAMSSQLRRAGIMMTAAGGAMAAALGVSIKKFAEAGDEVQKMAMRTGFSTEALSELRYAAELSGASLDDIERATKRMSKAIVDATEGMSTYVRAFDRIGISAEDLIGLSPEKQFEKIAMAIADLEDHTLKAATAQDIFGRAGTSLLPLLEQGSEGIAKLRQEARDLGIVFDQEAANKAAEFNDALTRLDGSITGLKMAVAEQLIPVLLPLLETVKGLISSFTEWAKQHPELSRALTTLGAGASAALVGLGGLGLMLPTLARGVSALARAFSWLSVAARVGWANVLGPLAILVAMPWKDILEDIERYPWARIIGPVAGSLKELFSIFEAGDASIGEVREGLVGLDEELRKHSEEAKKAAENVRRSLSSLSSAASEFVSENLQYIDSLGRLPAAADTAFEDMMSRIHYARSEAGKLGITMEDIYYAMEKLGWPTKSISIAFKAWGTDITQVEDSLRRLGVTAEDIAKIVGKLPEKTDEVTEAFNEMMKRIRYADTEAGKLGITMYEIYDALDELGWPMEKIKEAYEEWGMDIANVEKALKDLGLTAEDIARIIGKLTDETEKGAEAWKQYKWANWMALKPDVPPQAEAEPESWYKARLIGEALGLGREASLALAAPETYGRIPRYLEALEREAPEFLGPGYVPAHGVGLEGRVVKEIINIPLIIDGEVVAEKVVEKVGDQVKDLGSDDFED